MLKDEFPSVPLLAMTATATEQVKEDIIQNLRMSRPRLIKLSFNRPNLAYEVRKKGSKKKFIEQMATIIRENRGKTGIVCLSRRHAKMWPKHSTESSVMVQTAGTTGPVGIGL